MCFDSSFRPRSAKAVDAAAMQEIGSTVPSRSWGTIRLLFTQLYFTGERVSPPVMFAAMLSAICR